MINLERTLKPEAGRIKRERKTISVMAQIYCHDLHGSRVGLCPNCAGLLEYAFQRLDRCVFEANKPTCAKCPIHCYKKDRREQVRAMMRYAGPRMLLRHPILAVLHLFDGKRHIPEYHRSPG